MKSFVKGTIFLAAVIFISKLFGFFYRMQFMRIAGPEVVGIYITTYPAYIFFISVVQLGTPLAVTKLVAEFSARKDKVRMKSVMRKAMQISTVCIVLFIPLLFFFSPFIASNLLQNEQAVFTLYISLLAIPFVIYSAIFRAYLQGIEKINLTAWSMFFEQVIRIALISLIFPFFIHENIAITAAIAMAFTAITEIFAFAFIIPFYRRFKMKAETTEFPLSKIFSISLPTAGGKLFGTFTWFLEPIVFLKALTTAGITAAAATTLYGVISGVHIPLLLFPAFVPAALSIVLVPAISNAFAKYDFKLINERISITIRTSAIIGCYAATVFFLYGDELAVQLFHLEEKGNYMKILAPIFFFYYVQSPLMSILQALDGAKIAMWNSVYGGIGKLALLFALAAQPSISVYGAIIAIGFGVLITTFLHMASIRKIPSIQLYLSNLLAPYCCFIAVCFIPLPETMGLTMKISVTLLICTVLLILFKQLRTSDFVYVKKLFS